MQGADTIRRLSLNEALNVALNEARRGDVVRAPAIGLERLLGRGLPVARQRGQRLTPTHILMVELCVATHCHWPLGIITQVSVQRSCSSNGLLAVPSEPLPL